jgi:hypothetical protein
LAKAIVTVAALGALVLTSAGCGTANHEKSPEQIAAERRIELKGGGRTGQGSPANPAPKGSSTFVKELYRQFPPPEPDPRVAGAAAAIRAGERACAGKTPVQVKEAFYHAALEGGRLDPESSQAEMIEKIDQFEAHVTTEASFTAGQLAADAYGATLPVALAASGFQGCIYALAKQLERRVSGNK